MFGASYVGGLRAEHGNGVGHALRAMALGEVERFHRGWALRLGGVVAAETVLVAHDAGGPKVYETFYAPVGAVTFEFTPVITRALRQDAGR